MIITAIEIDHRATETLQISSSDAMYRLQTDTKHTLT